MIPISCLNFWDEAWWFLSLRVSGLLPSSLLLFPQRYGRYVLWPSSGVCRTQDRRIEDNTRKLTTVYLLYIKGLGERIQKICSPYDIRTVFTSDSSLRRYLFRVKPPTKFNMIKDCVYSIPCSCGKIYKGKTGRPLKVRLEEHRKAVVRGGIEKSGMLDHIWKKKGNICPYGMKLK